MAISPRLAHKIFLKGVWAQQQQQTSLPVSRCTYDSYNRPLSGKRKGRELQTDLVFGVNLRTKRTPVSQGLPGP